MEKLNEDKTTSSKFNKETWLKVKKILNYVLSIIMYSICLSMIIVFMAFIINFIDQKSNLSKGVVKPPLFSAYTIISPSMVPKIKVLDVVVTKRISKPEDIEKGDVVTFNSTDYRYSGTTITHRVVSIEKTSDGKYLYTTRGDANNTNDSSRLSFDDIYGKVILRIPKIGYIQYFLSNFLGWVFIIILPTILIIVYDVIKLVRTVKKDPKNKISEEQQAKKAKEEKPKISKTDEERKRFK